MGTIGKINGNGSSWPDLIKLILEKPFFGKIIIILVFIACVEILICLPILAYYGIANKNLLNDVAGTFRPLRPQSDEFATFRNEKLITNEGSPFNICTDSMFGGESQIWPKISKYDDRNDYFMSLKFDLNRGQSHVMNSYVCVYAEWTPPPVKSVDISEYEGISLKSRLFLSRSSKKDIKVLVGLSMDGVKDFACHEYNFAEQQKGSNVFSDIKIPFADLVSPDYYIGNLQDFNPKAVYRLTLAIRGEDQAGILDIDDLKLYKKNTH